VCIVIVNDYFRMEKKVEADNKNTEGAKEKAEKHHDHIEEMMNMDSISSWNETVVRDFLMRKNLSDLLPLCNGINGEELRDLYGMCKSSSASMYHSLKSELLYVHDKVLPISTFLHFISQLRAICDGDLPLNRYIDNKYLAEYFQDGE
jgi:hypothetical protein